MKNMLIRPNSWATEDQNEQQATQPVIRCCSDSTSQMARIRNTQILMTAVDPCQRQEVASLLPWAYF
jgi:hypothetical protein